MSDLPENIQERVKSILTDFQIDLEMIPSYNTLERQKASRNVSYNLARGAIVDLLRKVDHSARIDELNRKMTLYVELLSSADFKAAFSAALDQIDAINNKRIAELKGQSSNMENSDE